MPLYFPLDLWYHSSMSKKSRVHECAGCGTKFEAKQAPASGKCGPCNLKEMEL